MYECYYQFLIKLKSVIILVFTSLMSIYSQLEDVYFFLFIAFLVNILAGIVADVNANGKQFKINKAFEAFKHFGFYVFLVYFIFCLGVSIKDNNVRDIGVKWTTIIVAYFYLTNISRNVKLIFPNNEAIGFIYLILSTQIFSQLKSYLGINIKTKKPIKKHKDENTCR